MTTRILLILDESGSMSCQRTDMIESVKNMLSEQRKETPSRNRSILFTLVKFSNHRKNARTNSLADFTFESEDYQPSGGTALFDAIGETLNDYKDERNVIAVIVTDGMENASREYNHRQVTRMISDYQETKGWKFVYLSENIDQFNQGCSIGMGDVRLFSQTNYNRGVTQNTVLGGTCNTITGAGVSVSSGMRNIQSEISNFRSQQENDTQNVVPGNTMTGIGIVDGYIRKCLQSSSI